MIKSIVFWSVGVTSAALGKLAVVELPKGKRPEKEENNTLDYGVLQYGYVFLAQVRISNSGSTVADFTVFVGPRL